MKKLLLFFLLLGSIVTEAKIKEVMIIGGVSSVTINNSFSAGAHWGVQINNIHLEYVDNFEKGIGYYQSFTTPFLYTLRSQRVSGVNLGYEFSLLGSPKIFLMPTIGYFSIKNIFQSSSNPTTHFYDFYKNKFTCGLEARYYLNNNIGVGIGRNGIEKFKFSVCYVFFSSK